jgi:predicted enzyme related to lactoylglutathione lyase
MDKESAISYIEIPSSDLAGTKAFFGAMFGWEFLDYGPDYSSFNDSRLDGGFFKSDQVVSVAAGSPLIVFFRPDLERAVTDVETAGGKIVKPIFSFPGGHRFHFADPSGNEYAIWSDQ